MSNATATTTTVRKILAGHLSDESLATVVSLLERAGDVCQEIDKIQASRINTANGMEDHARQLASRLGIDLSKGVVDQLEVSAKLTALSLSTEEKIRAKSVLASAGFMR